MPRMSDVPILSLRGISFAYNDHPVLENVDLTVRRGDFSSIVGPNGGGKTTLIKLFLGLLQPAAGEVRIFGRDPASERHRIGYMPQHAHHDSQFPITVREVVLLGRLGRRLGGHPSRGDRQVAERVLDEVGLGNLSSRTFADLSGGERQRVLIARALCGDPELLLLDEPTANVDTQAGERLIKLLTELNKHMTILLVSHDLGFVSRVVRSVICVNRRVVVHPTSELTGEMIEEIYGNPLSMVRHDHRVPEGGPRDA